MLNFLKDTLQLVCELIFLKSDTGENEACVDLGLTMCRRAFKQPKITKHVNTDGFFLQIQGGIIVGTKLAKTALALWLLLAAWLP